MKLTNKLGLPEAWANAIRPPERPAERAVSVTQLIRPVRIAALEREHWDDIEVDVTDRLFMMDGQADHWLLEQQAGPDELAETFLEAEIDGERVTGHVDSIDLRGGMLSDWKRTSVYAVADGVKPEWEAQTNLYAWLCRKNGHAVTGLQIVARFRDWSRGKALGGGDYPQVGAAILPVPLWPTLRVESYLRDRLAIHRLAESGGPVPVCTPAERWERPETWAAMKGANKRAAKVESSREAAAAWILGQKQPGAYRVERRPGASVRCADGWCQVRDWCDWWQNNKPAENGGEGEGE